MMDDRRVTYTLTLNGATDDLLAWLCVETGLSRSAVFSRGVMLLKIAVDAERAGKELRVHDPAGGEDTTITGITRPTGPET